MLFYNTHHEFQYPWRCVGGLALNDRGLGQSPQWFNNRFFTTSALDPHSSIPDGYQHPHTAYPALNTGGMASRILAGDANTAVLGKLTHKNMVVGATGYGTVSATMNKVHNIAANAIGRASFVSAPGAAHGIAANAIGRAALVPVLGAIHDGVASLHGGCSLVATPECIHGIIAAIIGSRTATGAIDCLTQVEIDAGLTGTGSVLALLGDIREIAAELCGTASMLALLGDIREIAADARGVSSLSASIGVGHLVTANLWGASSVAAHAAASGDMIAHAVSVAGVTAHGTPAGVLRAEPIGQTFISAYAHRGAAVGSFIFGSDNVAAAAINGALIFSAMHGEGAIAVASLVAAAGLGADIRVASTFADQRIAHAVWDESLVAHADAGTTGKALGTVLVDAALIQKIESGRWKIVNNQMIFYDSDGTTPILVFDLLDQSGKPSSTNIFERTPT